MRTLREEAELYRAEVRTEMGVGGWKPTKATINRLLDLVDELLRQDADMTTAVHQLGFALEAKDAYYSRRIAEIQREHARTLAALSGL